MTNPVRKSLAAALVLVLTCGLTWSHGWAQHPDDIYWDDLAVPPAQSGEEFTAMIEYDGQLFAAERLEECVAWGETGTGLWGCLGSRSAHALYSWSGSEWSMLIPDSSEPGVGHVNAFAVYNGLLYAGIGVSVYAWIGPSSLEPLSDVNSDTIVYFGRWDGSAFQDIGSGINGTVHALCEFNGDLIIGGCFSDADGVACRNIVRFDGTSFYSIGAGLDSTVYALEVFDGELIAAGDLYTNGTDSIHAVAKWDGASWQQFGLWELVGEEPVRGTIKSLEVFEEELFAGGRMWSPDHVYHVARWDGATWNWEYIPGGYSSPETDTVSILIAHDQELFAGPKSARWDGSSWNMLEPRCGYDYSVLSCMTRYDDQLVGCCIMSSILNGPVRVLDDKWVPLAGAALSGSIEAVVEYDGNLAIGGTFWAWTDDGQEFRNFARWNGIDWVEISSFATKDGPAGCGSISGLGAYGGDLIVCGEFDSIENIAAQNIARWDGADWHSMGSGLIDVGPIELVEIGGDLILHGSFYQPEIDEWGLARWDGSTWHTAYDYSLGEPTAIMEVDGDLWVAGKYSISASRIDKWNGVTWDSVVTQIPGCGDIITSMTTFEDRLVVGGGVEIVGEEDNGWVAEWDGSSWNMLMHSGYDCGGPDHMQVFNGELYVMGSIVPRRWDGYRWTVLGSGLVPDDVSDLIVFDNLLVVAGGFEYAGDQPVNGLAAWSKPPSCCVGFTGNVDNDAEGVVDIGDLTALIGYLFIPPYSEPVCPAEANIDGEGTVDMGDLTRLIDYLFISYEPTAVCQ